MVPDQHLNPLRPGPLPMHGPMTHGQARPGAAPLAVQGHPGVAGAGSPATAVVTGRKLRLHGQTPQVVTFPWNHLQSLATSCTHSPLQVGLDGLH